MLATAATAITVPLIAAVAQSKSDRRRFEQDRLTKDFDELRALLDESSSELFRVLQVLERGELTEAETEEAVKPLATLNARLVMRLGRKHEVVRAFKHTVEVAWPEDVNDVAASERRSQQSSGGCALTSEAQSLREEARQLERRGVVSRVRRLGRPRVAQIADALEANAAQRQTLRAEIERHRGALKDGSRDILDQAERTAARERAAPYRLVAIVLLVLWGLQAVLIAIGRTGRVNSIHLNFYLAASAIFPIILIAGFVELGALPGRVILQAGVKWRALTFMVPTVAGEMARLRALAIHESTVFLFRDVTASLALTTASLFLLVLTRPVQRRTRAADPR